MTWAEPAADKPVDALKVKLNTLLKCSWENWGTCDNKEDCENSGICDDWDLRDWEDEAGTKGKCIVPWTKSCWGDIDWEKCQGMGIDMGCIDDSLTDKATCEAVAGNK